MLINDEIVMKYFDKVDYKGAKIDIYKKCPVYTEDILTLKLTASEDASELLKCYSDEKSVPLFNSDNCNGDDFHYTTIDRMKKAIDFWQFSYKNRYFIRFTVVLNKTGEKIGTVEMFKREANDEFNHFGVLRIDLQSKYEEQKYIDEILEIANKNFYKDFDVEFILTKAIQAASERIISLGKKGYKPIDEKFVIYDDYFINGNK
ncbi:GNAT family N-acetyltransferase [Clostridium sp.]|uniref:GNAT family N-acetyltransferase n=1 Tax=Clostridium sp. TaxID=1506 RepID=UPI00321696EA